MRTFDEIVSRCKAVESDDWMGTQRGDLIAYLPFDHAKPFLKEGASAVDWKPREISDAAVLAELKGYMDFAWGKANDCRGLSAGRSLDHMKAWLWLLGDDAMAVAIEDYSHYGKPQLRAICEKYEITWRPLDDGMWRNNEDEDYEIADSIRVSDVLAKAMAPKP